MKTAISIPDPIFESAERLAKRLGKSRSELYTEAVKAYVERHRDDDITARLNAFFDAHPGKPPSPIRPSKPPPWSCCAENAGRWSAPRSGGPIYPIR